MLKKPTLLCSCGSFQLLSAYQISSAAPHRHSLRKTSVPGCKRFAHVHGADSSALNDDLSWPSTPSFSPYDVFKQDRNAPYSKRRFYDLVKVYHPDRPCNGHPLCHGISEAVRMDRYRIIVAAHEILSDPVKREAYDKHGLGWHHRTELFGDHWKMRNGNPVERDPTIYANATWEDWEEWYQRQNGGGGPQTSAVSHGTFGTFLIFLTIFAGISQAVAIGRYSSFVQDRAREVSDRCSAFLDDRKREAAERTNSPDDRVKLFMQKRDPSAYGLKEEEEETYRQVFSPHSTSSSSLQNIGSPQKPPSEL